MCTQVCHCCVSSCACWDLLCVWRFFQGTEGTCGWRSFPSAPIRASWILAGICWWNESLEQIGCTNKINLPEFFGALIAWIGFFLWVRAHMNKHIALFPECFSACCTLVWHDVGMGLFVPDQFGTVSKSLLAIGHITFERVLVQGGEQPARFLLYLGHCFSLNGHFRAINDFVL